MVLLTLALACSGGDTGDTAGLPAPWATLSPRPLSALSPLVDVPLASAVAASRVVLLSGQPHALVLDAEGGKVHVFDGRYRHEDQPSCVPTEAWPEHPVDDRQREGCAEGEVSLHRGVLAPQGALRGVVADDATLLVHLWAGQRVYRADADLLQASPWDILRLDDGVDVDAPEPVVRAAMARGGGALWLASDAWLGRYALDGTRTTEWVLPGQVLDVAFSGSQVWVSTDAGLWSPDAGLVNGVPAPRLSPDGEGGVWLAEVDRDRGVHVGPTGAASAWDVAGLTGPVAADPATGRVAFGVDEGLVVVQDNVVLARVEGLAVRDVAVNDHHEIVALTDQGLSVFGDELALGSGEPLALIIAGFVEQPRSPDQDLPCNSTGDSIVGQLATAADNRRLLDDLPAGLALGITPQMARRALACGVVHDLHRVGAGERVEPGVLNHERPDDDCVADPDCHTDFLAAQHADVVATGLGPSWFSGLMVHEDLGADWAANLVRTGAVDTYLHFSLSVLPDIDHDGDPRAKQAYPPTVAGATTPLVGSTLAGLFDGDDGALRLLPGNALAAFRLSRCPNLTLWECNSLPGNGWEPLLRAEDIAVLRVLLFRASGVRSGVGAAWSFHLPDVGSWDYTVGCDQAERVWSGDDCQGALLQDWLLDVHASYVANDIVSWDLPRDLPWPE